jgi:uncharacterized protein involved in exopolysaccharide biosynthesis
VTLLFYRRNSLPYRIFDAFFRNLLPFFLVVIAVTGVVATVLVFRNASYEASSSIRVISDNEVSNVMGFSERSVGSPAEINTAHFGDLMQNLLPGGFVDTVVKTAGMEKSIQVNPQARDPRLAKLRKYVSAKTQSNDVFTIALVWDKRDECERLVKALQETYIKEAGLSRQSQAVATAEYLNSEIERYKVDLEKAEQALTQYKTTHSGQLPDAQAAEVQQFANLRMERDYLSITAQDSALKRSALEQRIASIKPTAILEQTIANDPIVQEIRGLQAKRNEQINAGFNPATSQTVGDIDKQIKKLEQQFASRQQSDPAQARNVVETKLQDNPEYMDLSQQLTDARIAETTQKARMALLNQQLSEYQKRISALPSAERELTEKTRDYTILKEQYEDLLQRRQQAELKANVERVTASSTLIVQNPVYAEEAISRSKKMIMIVGSILLGLIIGFGVIILREWMDPSFRYEADAAQLLGVPILAGLPESSDFRFPLAIRGTQNGDARKAHQRPRFMSILFGEKSLYGK